MLAIRAVELRKRYGDTVAVDGVSIAVEAGEILGLLGPNGAGKTTTVEMIEGLRQPDAGTIHVLGLDLRSELAAVRQRIGVQLQTTALYPRLTVREETSTACTCAAPPWKTCFCGSPAATSATDPYAHTPTLCSQPEDLRARSDGAVLDPRLSGVVHPAVRGDLLRVRATTGSDRRRAGCRSRRYGRSAADGAARDSRAAGAHRHALGAGKSAWRWRPARHGGGPAATGRRGGRRSVGRSRSDLRSHLGGRTPGRRTGNRRRAPGAGCRHQWTPHTDLHAVHDRHGRPPAHDRLPGAGHTGDGAHAAGLFGTAAPLVQLRERQVLRRLGATPLRRSALLASQLLLRLTTALAQVIIIVAVGRVAFGVEVGHRVGLLAGFCVLGALTFVSLGYLIAALSKTEESVFGITSVLNFPMMFLSGIFFPLETMPDWIRPVVQAIPLTYLGDALRQTMVGAPPAHSLGLDALVLGIWLAVASVLAVRLFRWE